MDNGRRHKRTDGEWTDGQASRQTNSCNCNVGERTSGRRDGLMDGRTGGQTSGWEDGRADGRTEDVRYYYSDGRAADRECGPREGGKVGK